MPKKCSNCGTLNKANSKFCKKCGNRLDEIRKCPQCGNSLDADSEFCQQCGAQIRPQKFIPQTSISMKRLPLGLEILIVLGVLGAVYYLYSSLMVIYFSNTLFGSSSLTTTLTFVGLSWAFFGLYFLVLAYGLWKLKEWARNALMIQAVLGVITIFFNQPAGVVSLVYALILLWYINQPHIKMLFESGKAVQIQSSVNTTSPLSTPTFTGYLVCPQCGKKGKPGERFCKKCGNALQT
jgi:hypothetical protein